MKQLTHVMIDGLKCHKRFTLDVPQFLAVSGPNGAGKSAIAEAIRIGVLGYEPTMGKKLEASRKLLADGYNFMLIELGFSDGFEITRSLGASTATHVHPTRNERTEKELQSRIDRETGAFIPSFDLAAFLDLSAEKRREFLLRILPRNIADLDAETWRHWLGYEGADETIRAAIEKLWRDHVQPSESLLDGLATALQLTTEHFNRAEQARRDQVAISERADQDARRASETMQYDPQELGRLQEQLRVVTDAEARFNAALERAERARTEQRHREHQRNVHEIRVANARREVEDLGPDISPGPTPESLAEARSTLDAARYAHREKRHVFMDTGQLVARSARDVELLRGQLSALADHEACPICGSRGDHLAAARALIRSELDHQVGQLDSAKHVHEDMRASVVEADQLERHCEAAVDALLRHLGEIRDRDERRAQAAARLRDAENEQRAFLALPPIEIEQPVDYVGPTFAQRISKLQASIAEQQDLARLAGRAEADRARADRERHELAARTQKSEALKALKENQQKLRAHVIEQLVGPVQSRAQQLLQAIDSGKTFRFLFEREGKPDFDFGFEEDGVFRSYDAASTGEDAFLAVVLVAALVATVQPAWPVLLLDNAEAIDETRRRWLMIGLRKFADVLGNVIIAGCCTFPDVDGWHIEDLGTEEQHLEAVA